MPHKFDIKNALNAMMEEVATEVEVSSTTIDDIKSVEKYYSDYAEQIDALMERNGYGKPLAIIPNVAPDPQVYMIVGLNVTITIKGDRIIKEFYTYKV